MKKLFLTMALLGATSLHAMEDQEQKQGYYNEEYQNQLTQNIAKLDQENNAINQQSIQMTEQNRNLSAYILSAMANLNNGFDAINLIAQEIIGTDFFKDANQKKEPVNGITQKYIENVIQASHNLKYLQGNLKVNEGSFKQIDQAIQGMIPESQNTGVFQSKFLKKEEPSQQQQPFQSKFLKQPQKNVGDMQFQAKQQQPTFQSKFLKKEEPSQQQQPFQSKFLKKQ